MDGDELLDEPRPPSRRGRLGVLLGAAVVVAALLVGFLNRHQGNPSAQPTDTSAPTTSGGPPPGPLTPTATPSLAHPLPAFGEHVELYARADGAVADIDLAAGSMLLTHLYPLRSSGPVSFVATSAGALVRPLDFVPGYLVRSGRIVRQLGGALDGGTVLPGPSPDKVWAEHRDVHGALDGVQLVDARTGALGRVLRWPAGAAAPRGFPQPDGTGYVLVRTAQYVYDLRPDGAHRLPVDPVRGIVLAAGGGRLLVVQCPAGRLYNCPATVVRLPDGTSRRLPTNLAVTEAGSEGVISPDGHTALVYQPGQLGRPVARLLDLDTGTFHGTPVVSDPQNQMGSAAFAPDGRWVFLPGTGGRLLAVDAGTGTAHTIVSGLPTLYQLAVGPLLG